MRSSEALSTFPLSCDPSPPSPQLFHLPKLNVSPLNTPRFLPPTPSPYLKCIFSILCLSLIFLHCILSYYLTLLYVPNMFDICFTYKNISSVRQELCLVHYCELYFWHLGSVEFDESMNCLVFESGSH